MTFAQLLLLSGTAFIIHLFVKLEAISVRIKGRRQNPVSTVHNGCQSCMEVSTCIKGFTGQ